MTFTWRCASAAPIDVKHKQFIVVKSTVHCALALVLIMTAQRESL